MVTRRLLRHKERLSLWNAALMVRLAQGHYHGMCCASHRLCSRGTDFDCVR
jgi:hypothetical protein